MVLMPVFALFFPVPLAIAATAVVHFANNLFKLGILAKEASWRVVVWFGVPAVIAAIVGAKLLIWFDRLEPWTQYSLGGGIYQVTPIKAIIGALIIAFALLEFSTRFQRLAIPVRYLPIGGAISGFFGGLSGNQGALRAAFLVKLGLSKEAFVATSAVSAVLVDAARLTIYGTGVMAEHLSQSRELVLPILVGTLSAFAGALLGKSLLKKVTLRMVQLLVAAMMLIVGICLVLGLI